MRVDRQGSLKNIIKFSAQIDKFNFKSEKNYCSKNKLSVFQFTRLGSTLIYLLHKTLKLFKLLLVTADDMRCGHDDTRTLDEGMRARGHEIWA